MQPSAIQQFKTTLEKSWDVKRRGRGNSAITGADFCAEFIDSDPKLCRSYLLAVARQLIDAHERRMRSVNPELVGQLRFLGEDFARLFRTVTLKTKDGMRQVPLMTVTQLRQAAVTIRARVSKRASQQAACLEDLADQMSPFAQTHPKITLGAFLELRAEGIEVAAKK